MSREIKFRAWDLKEKKMYYSPYCIDSQNMGGSICVTPGDKGCEDGKMGLYYGEEIDFELMQYTGLLDKNGKEIYHDDLWKGKICGVDDIFQIVCSPPQMGALWENGVMPFIAERMQEGEIVGNVWETPELLKEKKV